MQILYSIRNPQNLIDCETTYTLSDTTKQWRKHPLIETNNTNTALLSHCNTYKHKHPTHLRSTMATFISFSKGWLRRSGAAIAVGKGVPARYRLALSDRTLTSSIRRLSQQNRKFNSYLYPLATEAPEVSATTAAEAAAHKTKHQSAAKPNGERLTNDSDPFDDAHALSESEREELVKRQREELAQLRLSDRSNTPITPRVPGFVPPNVPSSLLEAPETLLTTLDNGVRVVSQETYGQVSTTGVFSTLGSRFEGPGQAGLTHLLELLAFGDTQRYSGLQITQQLQDWGGTRFAATGREQSLWGVDLLRPNLEPALELLLEQVLLQPLFTEAELEQSLQVLEFQALDMPPELLLSEALQAAAYGPDQALGKPHFALHFANNNSAGQEGVDLSELRHQLHQFWQNRLLQQPQGLVVAGAGVEHSQLVELTNRHLGGLQQAAPDQSQPHDSTEGSRYQGARQDLRHHASPDGLVRVALAVPTGGWHSQHDIVTACVLQTLLGGGSSFSAGGPGKGMYSRLYRQLLNRYSWAESAEAFTSFSDATGLWGISGSTVPSKVRDMVQVLASHMARLAVEPVLEEELSRARNMVKCNVLTQLESRLALFEDLGRQVLTYGRREDVSTTCKRIEAVSAQDILELAQRSLQHPVSLAGVGEDLGNVPDVQEVMDWIKR